MGRYDSGSGGSLSSYRSGTITAVFHLAGKEEELRMRFRKEVKFDTALVRRFCNMDRLL